MQLFAFENIRAGFGFVRKLVRCLLFVSLSGGPITASTAFAANYYCNPASGSMGNSGLSTGSAWSSLEAVFSAGKTFAAGDVIHLMAGNHGSPVISSVNAGNVTITNYTGHDPVLKGIEFKGAAHWVLEGVRVHNPAPRPENYSLVWPVAPRYNNSLVRMTGASSDIAVKNCAIYSIAGTPAWTADQWNETAWNGIYVANGSHHITIDSCDVTNTNFAIHMEGNTHHMDIRYNVVQNFCGDGIRANCNDLKIEYNVVTDAYLTNGNHYDLIQGFSHARVEIHGNILISTTSRRSLVANSTQGIGAFDGWMDDWVIENNLVVVAHYHGITLLGARNCRVVNNTVMTNPFYTGSMKPWITIGNNRDGGVGTGNVMRNNLSAMVPASTYAVVGTTQSNNLITTRYTSHFVDYAGLDFRLKTGSSAIDAGTTEDAPTIDLNEDMRFAPYDIGCYEHPLDIIPTPKITLQPQGVTVAQGNTAFLEVASSDNPATLSYRWWHNGTLVAGATASRLELPSVKSEQAGLYQVELVNSAGSTLSRPAIVGVTIPARTAGSIGTRDEWQNIVHPNGNVYDQFVMNGAAGSLTPDAGQIARVSFVDPQGDIVQVEMSGQGTLTIALANATGPAEATSYHQPGVLYMQGSATLVLANANESTYVAVFSVGSMTNPGVIKPGVTYESWASIRALGVHSDVNRVGGLRLGNGRFEATSGVTGLWAPGVTSSAVFLSDIAASATATPILAVSGSTEVGITGGGLFQPNQKAIQVEGIRGLRMRAGMSSSGQTIGPSALLGRMVRDGTDITDGIVLPAL